LFFFILLASTSNQFFERFLPLQPQPSVLR